MANTPTLEALLKNNLSPRQYSTMERGSQQWNQDIRGLLDPIYQNYGINGVNQYLSQKEPITREYRPGFGMVDLPQTTRASSLGLKGNATDIGGSYNYEQYEPGTKKGGWNTLNKVAKVAVPVGLGLIGGAAIGGAAGLWGAGAAGSTAAGTTTGTTTGVGMGMTPAAAMPAYSGQIGAAKAAAAGGWSGANIAGTSNAVANITNTGGTPNVLGQTNNLVSGAGSNPELNYLKEWGTLGSQAINAYNEYRQGKQTDQLYNQQREISDPFGAQRPQYQKQLSEHMSNPNAFMNSPIAEYSMNAAARKMASMGYNMSDAQSQAIADNAIKEYYNQANILAELSGANISPNANAFGEGIQNQLQDKFDRNSAYANLARGIYDVWGGNDNSGQKTSDFTNYFEPVLNWWLS